MHDFGVLKEWLARKHGGNNFLSGIEDKPWRNEEVVDLVALSARPYARVTRWVIERAVPWLYSTKIPWKKVRFTLVCKKADVSTLTFCAGSTPRL